MSATPMVSIGMPVYNGEEFLEEALNSILGQTYTDFELIISDNASTDRTQEIAQVYAARDHRIRYLRNDRNLGAAENYNRVFWASCGRYFKWAAHDDLCAPDFIARCLEVLERDDSVVLCYPKSVFVDEKGRQIGEFVENVDYTDPRPHHRFRAWLFERPGGWCNPVFGLIRSDTLKQTALIGKFHSSDYILMGELALRGKLHRVAESLFYRRDHPERSTLAHRTHEAQARWYDSSMKKRAFYLPSWRWFVEYLKAIARVPIGFREKVRALGVLMKWGNRVRSNLKSELIAATKSVLRRHNSSPSSVGQ